MALRGGPGTDRRDAMSDKGVLERRTPPSRESSGGDCEERPSSREKLVTAGESKDEVVTEPEE